MTFCTSSDPPNLLLPPPERSLFSKSNFQLPPSHRDLELLLVPPLQVHLLASYEALQVVSSIPLNLWSLCLVHDGWFRAYATTMRIAKQAWLHSKEELIGNTWMMPSYAEEFEELTEDGLSSVLAQLAFRNESQRNLRVRRGWHVGRGRLDCLSTRSMFHITSHKTS